MSVENTGVQMRAMAQHAENEPQEPPNQDMSPTVELHKTKDDSIKEFVRRNGTISLDWYVPDFSNTRVGDLIEQRLPLETTEGRILFSCPALSEFFKTSNFELDLKTGWVYTYLDLLENIGITCQKDPFNPELLCSMLQDEQDASMAHEETLERIPSIKKLAGPADTMSQEKAEYKIYQFCQLWKMYVDNSVELRRKSELSQESAVTACRVYIPYISDIVRQLDEIMKIFAIEKELRTIKNRGYFPVPQITHQDNKIETARDKDKVLGTIDEIATAMIKAVRQSEENYVRQQEQARARDELTGQASTTSHQPTARQSEMITQDRTRKEYTSIQIQHTTSIQLHQMATTTMNHPRTTP